MSEADEILLRKMYGWDNPNPLTDVYIIFLLIVICLIIPYIYINLIEVKVKPFLKEIWWKISFNGRKILRIR